MKLLIGQDTELFLKRGDYFISAYGVIPGNKKNPYPVKRGAVQVDGMALEFNTKPAHTFDKFKLNINTVLSRLQDMIPDDCEMVIQASANFPEGYIDRQPDEARLLGCDPDYNAYTEKINPPPNPVPNMRTASGHVHFGWTKDKDVNDPNWIKDCAAFARQCDYYLGVPSILQDPDRNRRQMYGRAGAFRPKPYGMEYRVLSNYWIAKEGYMAGVFNQSIRAFQHMNKGRLAHDRLGDTEYNAERTINKGNEDRAMWICAELGIRI